MKDTNTKNILKKLAQDAKNRLKTCTYKDRAENQSIKRSIAFENHVRMVMESECRSPEITIKVINDYAEREEFENRVYKLLETNADCISPLKELADTNRMMLMTDTEKQKYILDLAERYNAIRDNYYKQKRLYI